MDGVGRRGRFLLGFGLFSGDMDVSENSGFSPPIIHLNRVFHYKPSILGYLYFWKHPYVSLREGERAHCMILCYQPKQDTT